MIKSPLTNSPDVNLIKQLDAEKIIQNYQNEYNTDVSAYFKGITKVDIYQCKEHIVNKFLV